MDRLVFDFCAKELAVEARDVAQLDVLRALGSAGTGVGAVTESEFVHLGNHCFSASSGFHLALRKESELAHLGRNEEHSGAVFAGGNAGATTDARSRVHSLGGSDLRDGHSVGILSATAVERYITAGLLNLIEGVTVNDKVFDYRESGRAPRLNGDSFALGEAAHVELASSGTGSGAVRVSVDIERTHTADTFAAVVVESHRLLAFFYERFI